MHFGKHIFQIARREKRPPESDDRWPASSNAGYCDLVRRKEVPKDGLTAKYTLRSPPQRPCRDVQIDSINGSSLFRTAWRILCACFCMCVCVCAYVLVLFLFHPPIRICTAEESTAGSWEIYDRFLASFRPEPRPFRALKYVPGVLGRVVGCVCLVPAVFRRSKQSREVLISSSDSGRRKTPAVPPVPPVGLR